MSLEIDALLTRARIAAGGTGVESGGPSAERLRLERLASEFESMLMAQMLRDMRRAGRWDEGADADADGFAATPLFEMLDTELAAQMARANGLGLATQLLDAFDRAQGRPEPRATAGAAPAAAGVPRGPVQAVHETSHADSVDRPVVTSGFGWRRDPFTGEARFHRGVDLRAAYGEHVMAADPGRVVFSGTQGGYGTTVTIEHADGTQTRYAHLSATLVRPGDLVAAGQPVGQAGSSGRATGPHLHFERLDAEGRPMDPLRPDGG